MFDLNQWRNMTTSQLVIQFGLVGIVILVIWGAYSSATVNLAELGITSGFGFLDRNTGWSYSFSLIDRSIDDTYFKTLTIGLMNTLFVGIISIVLVTFFGFLIGTARDSNNIGLVAMSSVYVNIFRNIPLIVQIVFLYSLFIHMPSPRQAMSLGDVVFFSNRGLMLPVFNISLFWAAVAAVLALILLVVLVLRMKNTIKALGYWLLGTVVLFLVFAFIFSPSGESIISVPELQGLRFKGGVTASTELMAMVVGITLYGASYIAEIVRGGLAEVKQGQIEAGQSLGMSEFAIWWKIKLPMALRSIMPPLGNQWIFMMKATTIGIAIGFSDLFYIVSTSITQSGQTMELIGLLMVSFLGINYTIAQIVNLINARMELKGH